MPLVVKLKNPNHGKAAADEEPVFGQGAGEASGQVTVQEPGQSQGYEEVGVRVKQEDHIDDGDAAEGLLNGQTSFINLRLEQARSPSDDSGLDDLASAFAQSSIQDAGPGVGHPAPPTLPPPLVDVLVAPAVLGHRYVRGRDTSFIVERPERIRGVLLGLSTVLARLESEAEGGGPAQDDAYMDLSDRLGRLNVVEAGSARGQTTLLKPFSVLLSSRSLDLSNTSNGALGYIHAHPDEMLGAEAQGEPSQYAAREAAKASYDVSTNRQILPTSYANFLVRLCAQAPFSAPPPRPPRKLRSPKVRESADSSSDEDEGSARLSEVPIHMPQGDLYLCGPRPKPAVVKEEEEKEASTYFDKQAPSTPQHQQQLAEPKTPEGTANRTVPFPQNPDPQTPQPRPAAAVPQKGLDNEPQGSHWTAQGTRGAIEAALGACCTAVDRVVAAATLRDPSEDAAVERIDVDDLLKSLRPVPLNHNVEPTPAPASAALPARPPSKRAFVLTRPPGHHCSATQPSGFCWVNNVAVLAAHAYEAHGIDRIAVLDIDLHHGNGTQSLAWRINADSVRKDAEREAKLAANKSKIRGPRRSAGVSVAEQEMDAGRRGLKMFYGSLHDIESFPCEDGDEGLVKDASTCIMGAHGQWIWNIHLDSHSSPSEFAELYANKYRALLSRADEFFARTESTPSKSLVVLSTGFDACQHELPGMQRHGKYVPVSFYETFTRDVVWRLAETRTGGKVVSVLEGGYSERALVSATIGHLVGLSSSSRAGEEGSKEEQGPPLATREEWYGLPALLALEKAVSKQLGGAHGLAGSSSSASAHATPLAKRKGFPESTTGDWLGATMEAFWRMWEACGHERRTASQANKERKAGLLKPTVPVSPWTPRELRSARGTNASG